MPAADLAPLQSQQAAQHTRTGEGILQVQPIETLHDGEIGFRHRTRQVIDAAPADPQSLSLLGDRQIVLTVDHRFALSNPALVSAPSKKSFSSVNSPISAQTKFVAAATSHRSQAWRGPCHPIRTLRKPRPPAGPSRPSS